jgi:hypothetical protein
MFGRIRMTSESGLAVDAWPNNTYTFGRSNELPLSAVMHGADHADDLAFLLASEKDLAADGRAVGEQRLRCVSTDHRDRPRRRGIVGRGQAPRDERNPHGLEIAGQDLRQIDCGPRGTSRFNPGGGSTADQWQGVDGPDKRDRRDLAHRCDEARVVGREDRRLWIGGHDLHRRDPFRVEAEVLGDQPCEAAHHHAGAGQQDHRDGDFGRDQKLSVASGQGRSVAAAGAGE